MIRTVRLDRGFFGEYMIGSFEGDCVFFEVVAKQHARLRYLQYRYCRTADAAGAKLTVSLPDELKRRKAKWVVVSLRRDGGMGAADIFEML